MTWHSGSPKRTLYSTTFGAVGREHEPAVENAAVLRAAPRAARASVGADRLVHHLVDDVGAGERHRRVRAHAAGVRALVAVERALVVLRGGERDARRFRRTARTPTARGRSCPSSITHVRPASPNAAPERYDVHGVARVGERLGDDHALARGEPVGLDDVEAGQRLEERERASTPGRRGRSRAGRSARPRRRARPSSTPSSLRASRPRPSSRTRGGPARSQRVDDARDERFLGSDDDEIGVDARRRARRPRPGRWPRPGRHSPSSRHARVAGRARSPRRRAAERARPQPSACSRPPEPTTSTRAIRRRGGGRRSDRAPGRRRRT